MGRYRVTYRLIVTDLDGTLLTHRKDISPRTRRALEQAARRGSRIVVATGRSFPVARHFCDGLPLTAPQITYNGAVIHDPTADRELSCLLLPPEWVRPSIEFFLDANVAVACFTTKALYMDQRIPEPHSWQPQLAGLPEQLADMRAVAEQPCIKVVGFADAPTISRLRPLAEQRFGHALYVTQTSPVLLELLHPEVSKGAALRRIAQMLEIPHGEIVAFGDSHNDIDMLDVAGVGVAMGNASAEVKGAADMVTDGHDEDGIATALVRLGIVRDEEELRAV